MSFHFDRVSIAVDAMDAVTYRSDTAVLVAVDPAVADRDLITVCANEIPAVPVDMTDNRADCNLLDERVVVLVAVAEIARYH